MVGAIARAEELAREIPGSFYPPANLKIVPICRPPHLHRPGDLGGTDGTVDIFVAGVGPGRHHHRRGEYPRSRRPTYRSWQ